MKPPGIEIEGLRVRLRGRVVLDVPRFQVAAGRLAALMGPNGAGKTTLLRVCLGGERPARGRARVLGEPVTALRGGALARLRRRIGFVPQRLPARSELPLTVREVVAIGRTGRVGWGRRLSARDWAAVDEWIERLGLGGLAGRAFGELSGGEQRKAILARAMAQEPELLLLDEPTAHLDLGWRERLVATIQRLFTQTGVAILLVCHELEALPPACRQVALLEGGRLTATGTPEAVFTEARVRRLYGAGLRVAHQGGRHAVTPVGATAREERAALTHGGGDA